LTEFDLVYEGFLWLQLKQVDRKAATPGHLKIPSLEKRGDLTSAIPRMYRLLTLEQLLAWRYVRLLQRYLNAF
jgi:hypothetical protein